MKFRAAAFAALAGLCLSTAADARPYYYVFGGYDYIDAKGGSMNGGSLGFGWRPDKYFAFQLGGQYARDSGVNFYNGYMEMVGTLPLATDLSVFASLGAAYGKASTSTPIGTVSQSGGGYRIGLGAQYWFEPNWGLRASIHRQNVVGVADDFGLGVIYRF